MLLPIINTQLLFRELEIAIQADDRLSQCDTLDVVLMK